ncbi:unnamed protein product [Didymodactylos carnosus]|uniref:Uncharacterized protein n=1 Tax=Didymodactylos carnosus TaxID=1234261 RepID=A0A8S2IMS4_9BILA|nr:unnamed protein product [Didymodactylos carnosus]CAF3766531.1 unnamed protein product [Didymodactylos carnosus]
MASSLSTITTAANSNIDKDYVISSIDEIPDDVIKYANDRFYNFVEEVSGENIKIIFKVQEIRAVSTLLTTTTEDIIKDLLKYEDEEIEFIKQKCFYKDNDQYKLKLGIEREIKLKSGVFKTNTTLKSGDDYTLTVHENADGTFKGKLMCKCRTCIFLPMEKDSSDEGFQISRFYKHLTKTKCTS